MTLKDLFARDPRERLHAEELRRTLVEDLYLRSSATVWFLMPLLFVLREIARNAYEASAPVRWCFWATVVVVLARWALVLHHRRHPVTDPEDVDRAYRRFHYVTVLMGVGLAATVLFSVDALSFSQLALVCVFLTGVHSVALGSMAASPRTYLLYINPALAALLWTLLSRPRGDLENLLLAMIGLYVPVLSLMSLFLHGGLRHTILLGCELKHMALRDALTGLPNRRFLTEFMARETPRILRTWSHLAERRTPASMALILLDLDYFKSVNDEHGHAAGDEVLNQVAAVLEDAVRKPDLLARWGGEEFVIVARDLQRDSAWDLAERVRSRIAGHAFVIGPGKTVQRTCSIGFCLFPFSPDTPATLGWEQVLALADTALYQAKDAGRNRVASLTAAGPLLDPAETIVRAVKDDLAQAVDRGLVRVVREPPGRQAAG